MQTVSDMNRGFDVDAHRKQAELTDRVIQAFRGECRRAWTFSRRVEVPISVDEVMEDLDYGRD